MVEVGICFEDVVMGVGGFDMVVCVLECLGGEIIVYGFVGEDIKFCVIFVGNVKVDCGEVILLIVDFVVCYVFDVDGCVLCCF